MDYTWSLASNYFKDTDIIQWIQDIDVSENLQVLSTRELLPLTIPHLDFTSLPLNRYSRNIMYSHYTQSFSFLHLRQGRTYRAGTCEVASFIFTQ